MSKGVNASQLVGAKDFGLEKPFYQTVIGNEPKLKPLTGPSVKDLSLIGLFYANNIQLEDSLAKPSLMNSNSFALLPFMSEALESDETFSSHKSLLSLFNKYSSTALSLSSPYLNPRSYISVFNHFRSDYEDFT